MNRANTKSTDALRLAQPLLLYLWTGRTQR